MFGARLPAGGAGGGAVPPLEPSEQVSSTDSAAGQKARGEIRLIPTPPLDREQQLAKP